MSSLGMWQQYRRARDAWSALRDTPGTTDVHLRAAWSAAESARVAYEDECQQERDEARAERDSE